MKIVHIPHFATVLGGGACPALSQLQPKLILQTQMLQTHTFVHEENVPAAHNRAQKVHKRKVQYMPQPAVMGTVTKLFMYFKLSQLLLSAINKHTYTTLQGMREHRIYRISLQGRKHFQTYGQ